LNKKRPLDALYFANRIIQRDFPLRAYVAPNVCDPFMGAHSFSSVNALYRPRSHNDRMDLNESPT
jgi:hypothetical protein